MVRKPIKYFIYITAFTLLVTGCQDSSIKTNTVATDSSSVIEKSSEDVLLRKNTTGSTTDNMVVEETNHSANIEEVNHSKTTQSTIDTSIILTKKEPKPEAVIKVSLSYSSGATIEIDKDIDKVQVTNSLSYATLLTEPTSVKPNYIPTLNILGSIVSGEQGDLDIIIRIAEHNGGVNSDGNLTFTIVKNRNIIIEFDQAEITRQGQTVNNPLWDIEETNALYIFTYIGNNGLFVQHTESKVGLRGVYTSTSSAKGQFSLDATIAGGTGEEYISDNRDSETIEFNNIIDTQAPTISLNGESNMSLIIADTYIEQGATAIDGFDGDVTVDINGNVDTSQLGMYIVTYTATDKADNEVTIERTIHVVTKLNTAPIAMPQIILLDDQKNIPILLTASDEDDDNLSYSIVDHPEGGALSGTLPNLIYTLNANYAGNDSFTFKVHDGKADSEVVTVTLAGGKYGINDNNLGVYVISKSSTEYVLPQITDSTFNALSLANQYKIADKLLTSLFFAYSYEALTTRIESGTFISDIKSQLSEETNDMDEVNSNVYNSDMYYQSDYYPANTILTRFYEMKTLDKTYLNHWMSYILTQTILFAPATELDTVGRVDAHGVYNRLFNLSDSEVGMRYATFIHMQSNENWRRFRSPEDNGREMLEIYALDADDTHVPIAAQALKNWHLSRDKDTLVIDQDKNSELLRLMDDMEFRSGVDFYASLAHSKAFTKGVSTRLVDFMFTDTPQSKKNEIIAAIVSSNPETWSDILVQILFSTEYLLHTQRAKSAEENILSLMKKLSYNSYYYTFNNMRNDMINMGQSSMRYKLGKLTRVPMDNISFATLQKSLRDRIFRSWSRDAENSWNPNDIDDTHNIEYFNNSPKVWQHKGISSKYFMSEEKYEVVANDIIQTDKNFINTIFNSILNRDAKIDEMSMIINHLTEPSLQWFANDLNYENTDKNYQEYIRYKARYYIQYIVFEYILRLDDLYFYKEVE